MTVLEEAGALINGPRQEAYSHPSRSMKRIAALWTVYLGVYVSPSDVCVMMSLLKIARLRSTLKLERQRDSVVDAAGYLALLERIEEE